MQLEFMLYSIYSPYTYMYTTLVLSYSNKRSRLRRNHKSNIVSYHTLYNTNSAKNTSTYEQGTF